MLVLWSIPMLTLYLLVLQYSSSSSSSECEERYGCNMHIFCTSEQSDSFLVDEDLNGLNKAFSDRRCHQIMTMTSHPELSKSCHQGFITCAACFKSDKAILDNEDKLREPIFVYPMKSDGRGYSREIYSFKGGGIHWVYMNFPHSLRAAGPYSFKSNRQQKTKGEEKNRGVEEKALCLRLDRVLNGISNLSTFFALYHQDFWPLASDDWSVARTWTNEAVNVLEKDHIASPWTSAQLGMSRKAPRRVLRQTSASLLKLFPLNAFSGSGRDSLHEIAGEDIGEKYNHPSIRVRFQTLFTRPRSRQQMQFYPNNTTPYLYPLPPPPPPPPPLPPQVSEDPDPYGGISPLFVDNASYNETLIPTVNGPTQVTIQNVSIYLTGVLFNNFSISSPPGDPGTNASEYEVVLQVDAGSMLIYLPPELCPTVKHQVAVGNFWIAVPEEDWSINAYEWVPGAGIQFQCTLDVCNSALKTLTYGKGLGTGRKSKTVFTLLVYPIVSGEAVTVAKAMKSCTMDIVGAGAWFTIFQYTKVFYTTSLGVLGMGLAFLIMLCCILGCCVCWQNRKEKLFNKRQVFVKVEDALYDETRVFNPFWIPSAAVKAGDNKFVITPNPKFLQQLQSEHLTRMQSIGKDGTLDAMQFLAAAQAAAAASSDVDFTRSEGEGGSGEESTTATETIATGGSSLGSSQLSGSSKSSRTSGTSRTSTSKSIRFSLKHDSGNTSDTDESTAGESDYSD